ncbi:MAG: transporter substrate-binding domain-containing protein [Colwellia sp.]|nr:transporter substrate-binding domain-containing protein [Colwellia sp.]
MFTWSCLANTSKQLTCYSSIYAPYSYLEAGQPTGIDIDLINIIADKIGIDVTFKIIPWSRLKQSIVAGKIDCAAAFLPSSAFTKKMFFMKYPITTGEHTIFIKEHNKNKFKTLTDFYGYTIAVNRGFKTPLIFSQAITDKLIKKYDVGDELQSLQMLSASRVEGVLTDKSVGLFNLHQLKINNIIPLAEPLTSTPVFLVFSKKIKDTGLIAKFDQALISMQAEGIYQKIIDKYLLY